MATQRQSYSSLVTNRVMFQMRQIMTVFLGRCFYMNTSDGLINQDSIFLKRDIRKMSPNKSSECQVVVHTRNIRTSFYHNHRKQIFLSSKCLGTARCSIRRYNLPTIMRMGKVIPRTLQS